MNEIAIPHIADEQLATSQAAQLQIDQVNWQELYPHCPKTHVKMHHNDTHLCITWKVEGEQLKAVHTEDFARVSADSCVEFFCQVEGDEHYFNFEFNCIGAATASYRKGRKDDVVRLDPTDLQQVIRYTSVGTEPFEERDGEHEWTLSVQIPFELLRKYSGKQEIRALRANFYKCADDTKKKHYVSWNPIPTEKPDFHRPEYFGVLIL